MATESSNSVREVREKRGLSQIALACAIGLTRQSVHAIERGRATPAVDVALRIARALDCSVETLFGEARTDAELTAEWALDDCDTRADRVALANVRGRWLAYGLAKDRVLRSADAMVRQSSRCKGTDRLLLDPLRPSAESRENVVIAGCAPALGLLADRLNAAAGPGRFSWFGLSSTAALKALSLSRVHVAGVHLVDLHTGEANVPDVRRYMSSQPVVLVTLARWEVGLIVQKGNPKRIAKVSHLVRRGLRLVAREPGSGARRLLEQELKHAGTSLDVVKHAQLIASGHLEVAQAVALGAGDVGIATRDAAIAFDLDFIALAEERYDLVVPRDDLTDPRLVRMFDVMTATPLRRELTSLGYDVAPSGTRVAEIAAT
jgi:putative molybdopterin biosynthesis protein